MATAAETEKFESLLYKKLIGDKNARQRAYYYRKRFAETGKIPEGLLLVERNIFEGRRAAGRQRVFSPELEEEFIAMIERSAGDPEDIGFITEPLRRVSTYRSILAEKYGEENLPTLSNFYSLARRKNLWKFIKKPDYLDRQTGAYYFKSHDIFELVQMDGCMFFSFEIRYGDEWRTPQVIEIFDTGSRFMMAMDVYWTETNIAAVDIFRQWLRQPFPKKTIRFRPDNAAAFLNLERCIKELNRKYSAPGKFYLKPDYARAGKPKDKTHLESSHRALHNFEAMIINYFKKQGAFAGTRKKVRFKGKIKEITVTKLDISIDDIRTSGIIGRYAAMHNEAIHRFTHDGAIMKWRPVDKFNEFIGSIGDDVLRFSDIDIDDILKYGYDKKPAKVQPGGTIQFNSRIYSVVSGDFMNYTTSTPVKVSEVGGKLYIFNQSADGACIGEAVLTREFDDEEKLEKIEKRDQIKTKKNEFELLIEFVRRHGMTVADNQRIRLAELHREGLTLEAAGAVMAENAEKYDSYRSNAKISAAQAGMVLINLFFTHAMAYIRSEKQPRPYAAVCN